MNKQMKLQLESVIDAIVEGDTDAAKAAFHEYLRVKTQHILIGESDDEECDDDMEKDDKDEQDDEKEEKEDKKEDKKDKKKDEKDDE